MPLVRLRVSALPLSDARAVADRLGELTEPAAHATSLFASPPDGWQVDAYYEHAPDITVLAARLAAEMGLAPALVVEPVPDENWVAISQAALPPVAGGRFIVHGSHDRSAVGRRRNAIEIDAGEAFGTAHHATTLGCLIAIDRLARRHRFRRVLDLGCGTGVLAIAAALALPQAEVLASDFDPVAVAVASANVRRNRLASRVRTVAAGGLSHPVLRRRRPFDLVAANILPEPLIRLASEVSRAVSPGGVAVLSGIVASEARAVAAVYRSQCFRLESWRLIEGWATLVLVRRR